MDPAGVCVGIRGFAAGHKQQEINDQLVNKKGEFGTTENGVKVGLSMYQKYISQALTGDDVEVWVCKDVGVFNRLPSEQVDDILDTLKVE